jgi:hypothetical protein
VSGASDGGEDTDPATGRRDRVVVDHGLYTAQRAVVEDRWKLVRTYHPGQWGPVTPSRALFDLDADPAEQEDVAAEHPGTADQLERELAYWVEHRVGPSGDALRSVASSRPVGLRWASEDHDGLSDSRSRFRLRFRDSASPTSGGGAVWPLRFLSRTALGRVWDCSSGSV